MSGEGSDGGARGAFRWLPWLLIPVSLLSDPAAALPRLSYYFRDFTLTFAPLRLFSAAEISKGSWPGWNPYVNDGAFLLPSFYPLDLLHALWPTPVGVSWLLTVHFPIAALGFYALARALGAERLGAFCGGAAYALGGLAISALNLYVFFQALALAPVVAFGLQRASERGGRTIVAAAVTVALSTSTLAIEFVAQGVFLGILLGLLSARRSAVPRLLLSLGLGAGLASLPIAIVASLLPETARAQGFTAAEALSHSVHPVSLLQVVISGVFGSLKAPLEHWWGGRFFTDGFPYFFSLYLGVPLLGIAAAGLAASAVNRRHVPLLGVALIGLWYSLGPWGGLSPVVASLPALRSFRFPSKALLTPYVVVCLFAAFGLDRLRGGRGWRMVVAVSAAGGLLAVVVSTATLLPQGRLGDWLALSPRVEGLLRAALPTECGWTVLFAAIGGSVAWRVMKTRVSPGRGGAILAGLVVADLARAGAGANPQVNPAFFDLLPELRAMHLDRLHGERAFSYGVRRSPEFRKFLEAAAPGTGLWAFFVNRQTLFPFNNLLDRIETAEGLDRTSFLPNAPAVAEGDYDPARVSAVLPALRNAAVSRIVSLDALHDPGLRLLAEVPAGPVGLFVRVYEVSRHWPRAYLACRVVTTQGREEALQLPLSAGFDGTRDVGLESPEPVDCHEGSVVPLTGEAGRSVYAVVSDGRGYLVARESFARGWKAWVDGHPAPILRADGKHRAVRVGPGRHEVSFAYQPPGLWAGVGITAVAALAALVLWVKPVLAGQSPPIRG